MLAALRKERGMTQREIADKLGITQKAWQSYESGLRTPRPATMQNFSEFPKKKFFLQLSTTKCSLD